MLDIYKTLKTNPNLKLINGIYRYASPIYRNSELSNYLQVALRQIFDNAMGRSMFSHEMELACTTNDLRQAIPPQQFNYLRLLNLKEINYVLDLSADFGGIAYHLSDKVESVESIQADNGRAELAQLRCRDKKNVIQISEDIFDLTFAEKHYDLIILGDVDLYAKTPEKFDSLLVKARAALSESGCLILNTLNSDRLSKTFDAQSADFESQLPYADLYNTGQENSFDTDHSKLRGHNRKALLEQLISAGFQENNVYASFGELNSCSNLFSQDYLNTNINALNHCYRLGSINNTNINEYLLYKSTLRQHQQLCDLATRFTMICSNSSLNTRKLYDKDFAYFPGTGRKTKWRTITMRDRCAPKVIKQATHTDSSENSNLITQNLTPQPYINGKILIDDWLQAMLDQDEAQFESLIEEYSLWLIEKQQSKDFTKTAYDMLPFNVLVHQDKNQRQLKTIDPEWQVNTHFDADFVLFRALFWFAFENKPLIKPFSQKYNLFSIGMFVLRFMPTHNSIDDLLPFVKLEEQIQHEINQNFRVNSVTDAVTQAFSENSDNTQTKPYLQISWGNNEHYFDESNALSLDWQSMDGQQSFESELPINLNEFNVLRIDPIARKGSFRFNTFELVDQNGNSIWKLSSASDINEVAKVNNALLSEQLFITQNDDPYFLFDLELISKSSDDIAKLLVSFEWVWDEGYSDALDTLNEVIARQNRTLFSQTHNLNTTNAELSHLGLKCNYQLERIADLNQKCDDLDLRIDELNKHNNELHYLMLMRPTTRIKRVISRVFNNTLSSIVGKKDNDETEVVIEEVTSVEDLIGQNNEDYSLWIEQHALSKSKIKLARTDIEKMAHKPLFSILVPVYNTDPEYLIPMIRSVQNQIYPHWQLCLVDDCSPKTYLRALLEYEAKQDERITIQINEINQGIAVTTNDALSLAKGDYIALLDHDDEISIDALYENAKAINRTPEAGLIYSDEDKMDLDGNRLQPFFKPDYSPDYLDTNNYICHFTVIKKSIADEIGGFREGVDGSQDHDIILRAIARSELVVHIPKILYHWRQVPGSTAVNYDSKSYAWEAGRKAVEDNLKKKENGVRVEFGSMKGTYRVYREIQNNPLISIVIPFKDKPELLDSCLNSIIQKSTYGNFEIVGVSNNSEEALTFERMEHFAELDSRIRFVEKNVPFNFSTICNYGVEQANGDYIILLNNDIEIINNDWIESLLEHAQRPEIGAVGGKLLYPDGRVQHAGVVAGMIGIAGHPHKFFPDQSVGYHGTLHMVHNVSAVTGAMMMVSTEHFKQVGGLDEDNLAVAYNDIDLCLKLISLGLSNLYTPHSMATHHESVSRGYEDTDEKLNRLKKEQQYFLKRWDNYLKKGDPYYNPNLSLKNEAFSLNFKSKPK